MNKIHELTEIFITFADGFYPDVDEDFDATPIVDLIEKHLDRDDVDGVILPFTTGISIFTDASACELMEDEYSQFLTEGLEDAFGENFVSMELFY